MCACRSVVAEQTRQARSSISLDAQSRAMSVAAPKFSTVFLRNHTWASLLSTNFRIRCRAHASVAPNM